MLTPDIGLFFWSAIVFLILLFLLSRFAWGPIMAGLREREESIEKALQQAEEAKKEMAKLTAQNEQLLAEARAKRDELIKDAQKQATTIIESARAEASAKAAKDLEDARNLIQSERAKAVAEIKNIVADVSLTIAEKLVAQKFAGDDAQRQLVDGMLKEINVN